MRWANPRVTWDEVAKAVGRSREQVYRVRQTEAWEIAFRAAGAEHVEALAPAAFHALLKQWAKGNAAGAIEVLRAFGFLANEKVNLEHSISEAEVDREIERFLARLAPPQEAAPAAAPDGVAPNGASGPARLR